MNLMQGDCLERMKEIESGSVDMVLTDPPYGTTACKWDSIIPLEPMWEQLKRVIKPNGAIVMTASQPFTTTLIASNMKMFKYCWVWEKHKATNIFQAYKTPLKVHEDVCVFYMKQPTYNPQKTEGKDYKQRGAHNVKIEGVTKEQSIGYSDKHEPNKRLPTTIQFFSNHNQKKDRYHPTQKPIALMEYLIKTYTNESETVLDFTMGSGTTGVACVNLKRDFIGIEMDESYFNIAKERIDGATKQQELF